ncbi:MAG TPA: hypothetical protein VN644_18425 [Pyrinomonadaceae bacterium]|jgi:hypothetical protein|nr:hypothetical protein [Pyrinomonadaceae bacterium]
MASKKKSTKKASAKKPQEVVMWLRLPRPMKPAELAKLGLKGDVCFGGDTCIAATSVHADADIVVQADLQESLRKAGLSRRADPCFGGDTCIV